MLSVLIFSFYKILKEVKGSWLLFKVFHGLFLMLNGFMQFCISWAKAAFSSSSILIADIDSFIPHRSYCNSVLVFFSFSFSLVMHSSFNFMPLLEMQSISWSAFCLSFYWVSKTFCTSILELLIASSIFARISVAFIHDCRSNFKQFSKVSARWMPSPIKSAWQCSRSESGEPSILQAPWWSGHLAENTWSPNTIYISISVP